jgi:hypothetical protein
LWTRYWLVPTRFVVHGWASFKLRGLAATTASGAAFDVCSNLHWKLLSLFDSGFNRHSGRGRQLGMLQTPPAIKLVLTFMTFSFSLE